MRLRCMFASGLCSTCSALVDRREERGDEVHKFDANYGKKKLKMDTLDLLEPVCTTWTNRKLES